MLLRRFYARWSRMNKKTLDIKLIRKNRFLDGMHFMRKYFCEDPFILAMGINPGNKEAHAYLSALYLVLLKAELSLAAMHRNKICGLCINCPYSQGDGSQSDILLRLAQVVRTDATRNLLLAWDKIGREAPMPAPKKGGGRKNRIMELAFVAVGENYRNAGIASKLIQSSANLAMLLGFEYARIDCTNSATTRICNRLGWRQVWEMPFERFEGVLSNKYALDHRRYRIVTVFLQPVQPDVKKTR